MIEIGTVYSCDNTQIVVNINDVNTYERNKEHIHFGEYVIISDGNINKIVAIIQNVSSVCIKEDIIYQIKVSPIGYYSDEKEVDFKQGGMSLPSPTELVYIAEDKIIDKIFNSNESFNFYLGHLINNKKTKYNVDGNKLFGKHIAVVGSTGSGKSCAVARILQNAIKIENAKNVNKEDKKNSHIIIFDLHSEYENAFKLNKEEKFEVNSLNVEKLCLPYWLMNSDELESLFIESNEMNSYNQISQFKKAVILSKEKNNRNLTNINYDTPVYFDMNEVYNYIYNINREVINKKEGEDFLPKRADGMLITNPSEEYLKSKIDFASTSTSKDSKASNGPYNGEFERFLTRLDTKLSDKRLKFITNPLKEDGSTYKTNDFSILLQQFLGYVRKSNVTIIDLSAIPFEVLSIVVSLLSRIIFDFSFHYSKIKQLNDEVNDVPFLLVCEEAHNYIPKDNSSEYYASKRSIERIAKEGRKYGLSLMVVSQRPSEVSETIFSQCNNFIVLKLTNANDQNYIKKLLPNNESTLTNYLPMLSTGECLVVGDSCPLPGLIKLDMPNPIPSSNNVPVYDMWNNEWTDLEFVNIVKRWRKE